MKRGEAAAFGRLCVETMICVCLNRLREAAAFGRLCVETYQLVSDKQKSLSSRLRAAVC